MSYISYTLKQAVIKRAGNCCEYCLVPKDDTLFSFHIEHIIPLRHTGKTELENLCFSCPRCNLLKATDIASIDPQTKLLTPFFNPRKQKWSDHFQLDGPIIKPLSPEGRVLVNVLQLNSDKRLSQRTLMMKLGQYPCQTPE